MGATPPKLWKCGTGLASLAPEPEGLLLAASLREVLRMFDVLRFIARPAVAISLSVPMTGGAGAQGTAWDRAAWAEHDARFDWGECTPDWNALGVRPGTDGIVYAMTEWDPDRDGPEEPQLVVGGIFDKAGGLPVSGIATWDGRAWRQMEAGLTEVFSALNVRALTTWDPDGDGPATRRLIAGCQADGFSRSAVAMWDGTSWQQLGSTDFPAALHALAAWDPDGSGPLPERLIAGGEFDYVDGVYFKGLAQWNGSQWVPIGPLTDISSVRALLAWDADGEGPQPARLVVGGAFLTGGSTSLNRVGVWDGIAWGDLGGGFDDGGVRALHAWDRDGDGPESPILVAGGSFTSSNGSAVKRLGWWDGAAWQQIAGGVDDAVACFASADLDGEGPGSCDLYIGGWFTAPETGSFGRLARWNGSDLVTVGSGMGNAVYALSSFRDGGAGDRLMVGGTFTLAGSLYVNYITEWSEQGWLSLGDGILGTPIVGGVVVVNATTEWDPDGEGPLAPRLIAAGTFGVAGHTYVNRIAQWSGERWEPVGEGFSYNLGQAYVNDVISWDPDGDGPATPQLIAAGQFTRSGTTTLNRIARWDGVSWQPLGGGSAGIVQSLGLWDPDGQGPAHEHLIAGGWMALASGGSTERIGRWDGNEWHALGPGLNNVVRAITSWDPDGAGPLSPLLIAGGGFTGSGTQALARVAKWDGETWSQVGSGTSDSVSALETWDPDGAGPLSERLIVGGFFTAVGTSIRHLAAWDGAAWSAIGPQLSSSVSALDTWQAGDGTGPEALVIGGAFKLAGTIPMNRITLWNGAEMIPLGTGVIDPVDTVTVWDPDGVGPAPSRLVAGGQFTMAGDVPAGYIAWWGCPAPPPCPADVNDDGLVDILDFLEFIDAFSQCEGLPAPCVGAAGIDPDFNGDTLVDILDFLDFIDRFASGC